MILPIIYKKTKTGAIQQCEIGTKEGMIDVVFGQVDGVKQCKLTNCTGKNIGRANETTAAQQAEKEALSKWKKKIKAGYTEDEHGESSIKLPMRISNYQYMNHNVTFPCFGSPKLNGQNVEYRLVDDTLIMLSRGGERLPLPPHLTDHILNALAENSLTAVNGEMYCHGMWLEDIISAVKKPNADTPRLKFFAFEFPEISAPYAGKRFALDHSSFLTPANVVMESHEDLKEYHDKCVRAGYEGIVIRNACCRYQYGVRSSDAFKFKIPLDAEFKIVSCSVDKNGHPVFTVDNHKGRCFKVKPKGKAAKKLKILETYDEKYMGKWYTVEFESWSKYGVPLKPIGIGLRECDTNGKPLE